MAVALHVWIVDEDGAIGVEHVFYGLTEEETDARRLAHMGGCAAFSAAEAHDAGRPGEAPRVFERLEEIAEAELPQPEDFEEDEEPIDVEGQELPPEGREP